MSHAAVQGLRAEGPALGRAEERKSSPRPVFCGVLDAVLVPGGTDISFEGAIQASHARASWTWVCRDLAPDLIKDAHTLLPVDFERNANAIVERMRDALSVAQEHEGERRLRGQLGGEAVLARLPVLITALRNRALIAKATELGRAINALSDESDLTAVLHAIPLHDTTAAALMMMAMVKQVDNPAALIMGAMRSAGGTTEAALIGAGFTPLIEAVIAQAQAQLPTLAGAGAFVDVDLVCRCIERYHRLVRSISSYVELARLGRWGAQIAQITTAMSGEIEPKLKEVGPNVSQSLRVRGAGEDRYGAERLLAALNGMYLLASVKDCRSSLAVNASFEQTWLQVGQMLELLLTRNLDVIRHDPSDSAAQSRLEAGLKMAEIRFNADYADVLRRARDAALRRPTSA